MKNKFCLVVVEEKETFAVQFMLLNQFLLLLYKKNIILNIYVAYQNYDVFVYNKKKESFTFILFFWIVYFLLLQILFQYFLYFEFNFHIFLILWNFYPSFFCYFCCYRKLVFSVCRCLMLLLCTQSYPFHWTWKWKIVF